MMRALGALLFAVVVYGVGHRQGRVEGEHRGAVRSAAIYTAGLLGAKRAER